MERRSSTLELRWKPSQHDDGREVQVLIDGRDFIEAVRAWESVFARDADLAGAYMGFSESQAPHFLPLWLSPTSGVKTRRPLWELVGRLFKTRGPEVVPPRRPQWTTVLVCGDCGLDGCWPLHADIEVLEDQVVWRDFMQPYRTVGSASDEHWSYEGFGGFVFQRPAYEEAVLTFLSSAALSEGAVACRSRDRFA